MNRITSTNNFLTLSAIAASAILGSSEVHAQTATYVGTSGTSSVSRTLWSTSTNWTGTPPTNNTTLALVFSPSAYNYSNNDITGLTASSITFTSSPQSQDNDITGNAITLAGDVASNTGNYQHVRIDIDMGSTARDFSVTTGQLELYGVLSGSAGLTKSGGSPLVLAGKNTYTGGTTINNGTVVLTAGGSTGAIRGVVTVNSGGTLSSQAGDSFGYNSGTKVDTLNIVGGTVTHNSGSNLTISSAIVNMTAGTLQSTGSGGMDLYDTNGVNTTINTLISGNTATIAGKLNLRAGDNDGVGTVFTVADGGAAIDLNVTAVIANGSAQGANSIIEKAGTGLMQLTNANTYTGATKVSGGTLVLANQNAVQNSTLTTGSGSVVFDQSVSGKAFTFGGLAGSTGLTLQNNAGAPAAIALTVGGNNADTSYGGVLSGTGSLTKTGTGKLTLTNNNSFSGGTIISSGTLVLNTGGGAGAIRGTVTVNSGGTLSSTAGDSFGYNIGTNVNLLNIVGGTVTHNSSGNLTISSATINMTGGTLQSTNSGGLDIYNKDNSGQTTINTLASGSTSTIAGKIGLRSGDSISSPDTIFTVADGAAAIDLDVTAVVANGQYNSANSSIQKSGPGLMRLTGSNTYNGKTTVNSGTLELASSSGSAAGLTSSVKVLTTGTLLLSNGNQINDTASVSLGGGTIKFGAAVTEGSTSAVGVGALSLTASSTLDFGSFASTVTFASFAPSSFTLNVTNWSSGSSHLIFNADQSSNLSSFTINGLAASQISVSSGFYEITAVPEPGTIIGGVALLGCVGLVERKRIGRLLGSSSSRRIC